MKRDLKAFLLSFGLHSLVFLGLISLSQTMMYNKPILIDFTIEEAFHDVNNDTSKLSSHKMPEKIKREDRREIKVNNHPQPQNLKEIVKKETVQEEAPVAEASSEEQVPIPTVSPVGPSIVQVQGQTLQGQTSADDVPKGQFTKDKLWVVNSESPEKARQRYIKEHFSYIRDIITKNISYPYMARKMGWSGRVTVSFIIAENGSVKDIRIVESSGYDLLDKNAVDTVRKASPFPRPPVTAEIVVPVVYRLN